MRHSAPMAKASDASGKSKSGKDGEPVETGSTDNWIAFFFFVIFVIVCCVAWWLAHINTLPGAPGAPVG